MEQKSNLITFEQLPNLVVQLSADIQELKKLISENQNQSEVNPEPEFLTRKQTAERFHLSLTTLDTYTKLGIITAHKIGHRVLYRTADINESLREKIGNIKNKMK